MSTIDKKKHADRILYELGLFEKQQEFGVPHIIGSYRLPTYICLIL